MDLFKRVVKEGIKASLKMTKMAIDATVWISDVCQIDWSNEQATVDQLALEKETSSAMSEILDPFSGAIYVEPSDGESEEQAVEQDPDMPPPGDYRVLLQAEWHDESGTPVPPMLSRYIAHAIGTALGSLASDGEFSHTDNSVLTDFVIHVPSHEEIEERNRAIQEFFHNLFHSGGEEDDDE